MQGPDEEDASTGPLGVELPLDPRSVAQRVDVLTVAQLSHLGRRLLAKLATVSEAPGTKIHADSLHSQAPGSQPPSASPLCRCGCPSRADHHRNAMSDALIRCAASVPPDPRPLRGAIIRASFDLHSATVRRRRAIDPREIEDPAERDERMIRDYEGFPPEVAAELETYRTNAYVSAEAMARMRSRNSLTIDKGHPLPPKPELRRQVRRMSVLDQMSNAAIGRELGISRSNVVRILASPEPDQTTEPA